MRSRVRWFIVACLMLIALVVLIGEAEEINSYVDDFSDPTTGWLEYEDASLYYTYDEGEYVIQVTETNKVARSWAPQRVATEDFVVKTQFRQMSSGNGTCGLFWGEDDQHYVMVQVSMSGWYAVDEFTDGQWENLISWKTVDPEFDPSGSHELAVVKEGSSIAIYVDKTLLTDSLTDPGFDQYNVGVLVSTGNSRQMRGAFDDFCIGVIRPTAAITLPYDWRHPPRHVLTAAYQWGYDLHADQCYPGDYWSVKHEETPWFGDDVVLSIDVDTECSWSATEGYYTAERGEPPNSDSELRAYVASKPIMSLVMSGRGVDEEALPREKGDVTVTVIQGCLQLAGHAEESYSSWTASPSYDGPPFVAWYYDFNLDQLDPYRTFWVRIDYAGSSFSQEIDMSEMGHDEFH